jgi:3'-phosphoadenosine 5'-phosphosulfate sulfotransferase (PAPS reductase)/FAD synthetase
VNLIQDARRIFATALAEHDPVAVFLLTSGGNDSVVPLHLFHNHPRVTAAVHIDTGIKVPDVEPHVSASCEALGLALLIYRATEHTKADGTPDPQVYEDFVRKHGFPGPAQHSRMYVRLKERQLDRLVREHKSNRTDRVMLVTGVRKAESARRMGYVEEIQREGARVWVAPVANWSDADMLVYRKHHGLLESPVSARLGMSGECLCGAFAKPGELRRIAQHYPAVAQRIRDLERVSGCPWGWESGPDHQWIEVKRGQGTLGLTPLCTSCVSRGRAA